VLPTQDPRVFDAMLPFMTENFGNPHSRTHFYGWEAEAAVEEAREVTWCIFLFCWLTKLFNEISGSDKGWLE